MVLQNRGAGFSRVPGHPNELAPAKRPFHTIIPGMLARGRRAARAVRRHGWRRCSPRATSRWCRRLVDDGFDPQAALDAPRWRVEEDGIVELEPGLRHLLPELRAIGHDARLGEVQHPFGVGQMILRLGGALIGGSDGRGDGYAAGL